MNGCEIGLADDLSLKRVENKISGTDKLIRAMRNIGVKPEAANERLTVLGSSPIDQQVKLSSLITRPFVSSDDLKMWSEEFNSVAMEVLLEHPDSLEQAEIVLKYEGYIQREEEMANKLNRLENVKIPEELDYREMKSLSIEAKEKLSKIKPVTIGQASRVSGVSPSDISVLLIHLGR